VRDEQFIVECYLVSGGLDYVLKVVARDVDHYREIMDYMLAAEIGIEGISSFIALQQIKHSRGIPTGLIGVSSAERDQQARVIRRG
jgi:Lrp/AsnC family transcriptional regulator of ectoine degradation